MVYLYRENGLDYLMEYAPAMYQGYGTYVLRLFRWTARERLKSFGSMEPILF